MKLEPLPLNQLAKVEQVFIKAHAEHTLQHKATVEQAMRSMAVGYERRNTSIYMDDFDSPKHCLVLCHVPGVLVEGLMVIVMLIYTVPEERGNKESLNLLHQTIENYARIHGAETIIGSSWEYKGSRGIGPMWEAQGYEKQEITYVKLL